MGRIPVVNKAYDFESLPIGYLELSEEAMDTLTKNLANGGEYHLGFWISSPYSKPKLRAVWLCPSPCEPNTNNEPLVKSDG